MKILFKNAKILIENNAIISGEVVVADNLIEYVGNKAPKGEYDRVIDVMQNLLMPGFVNAHAHSAMTLLRGVKDDVVLDEWLNEGIVPLEQKMTDEDIYWGQMLGMAEYARNGITCFDEGYSHFSGMIKAINNAGYRARIGIGPGMCDDKFDSCYDKLKKDYNYIKNNTNPKLVNIVGFAHAIYSVSEDEIYSMLKFANENNIPLIIHLIETIKEVGDCTTKHKGLTPPAYLESLGYFDRECLCYHCVHMDKDDLQILADYNVNVATCPSSNIKLADGIAPIYAMQNKGINIAIGTDGAASNNCLDMFKEMFLVATLSKVSLYDASVVNASEVLNMATINGAKALGVNSGEIKIGKNADIILVNLNTPNMQPCENIISNSANGSNVYLTMVAGKIVYENEKYNIGEDIDLIYKKVNEIRKRLQNN